MRQDPLSTLARLAFVLTDSRAQQYAKDVVLNGNGVSIYISSVVARLLPSDSEPFGKTKASVEGHYSSYPYQVAMHHPKARAWRQEADFGLFVCNA